MSSVRSSARGNDHRFDSTRLAGGAGAVAARQKPEALLARATLACMMWESTAYESGSAVASNIASLIPQCDPEFVTKLAIKARTEQQLRHVPLFLMKELSKVPAARKLVGETLPKIILRPDEASEFLAMYREPIGNTKGPRPKRTPLAHQIKKGLGQSLEKFDEYQLAKWAGEGKMTKLRDVLILSHPKPSDEKRSILYKKLLEGTLEVPVTRETMLSASTSRREKADGFTKMIKDGKLGASAFLKSLKLMEEVGVSQAVIKEGLNKLRPARLLPLDFFKAAHHAPMFTTELDALMVKCLKQFTTLPGRSVFVLDVSGSMGSQLASKSEFTRMDAAIAMGVMASHVCEHVDIFLTAGDDYRKVHKTEIYKGPRNLSMATAVRNRYPHLGGGGIFTRQALEYIEEDMGERAKSVDRILVFSDSQDCDHPNKRVPKPFGKYNYVIDISSHRNGINYDGVWTQEISGWSQQFLEYVAQSEQLQQLNLF